jgi:hypothetical protein
VAVAISRHPDGYDIELHQNGTWTRVNDAPLLTVDVAGVPGDIGSFRGLSWGVSKETVRASRGAAPTAETATALQYSSTLNNEPIDELFIFHEDRLARGKCINTAGYVNDNTYLSSFSALKDLLIEKYGTPERDQEFWSNDLFRDDVDSWGTALASGHLARFVRWVKPSGDVWLVLKGENYEVEFELEYNSSALAAEVSAATKRARMEEI